MIRQKFDRMQMKMTMPPPVGGFEYDSTSDAAAGRPGGDDRADVQGDDGGRIRDHDDPRGEVKDVKVPEEVLTALKNSPGAAAMGDMATPEGFKKMISQGALVLPEERAEGRRDVDDQARDEQSGGGKQTIETTYRYEGTKDVDGTTYAVIRAAAENGFRTASRQARTCR